MTAKDMPDQVALTICKLPSMDVLLCQQRLFYFRRFAHTAPSLLHRLAQATADIDDGFVQCVLIDMAWLYKAQDLQPQVADLTCIDSVVQMVKSVTKAKWKSAVARAVRSSVDARGKAASVDPYLTVKACEDGMHVCPECSRGFACLSSLATHRYRKHQVKNPIRQYIFSEVCGCCMRTFHTRERMVYHAAASPRCRRYLLMLQPMSYDQAEDLDRQSAKTQTDNRKAGHAERKAHSVAFRIVGPRPRELCR